MSAQGKGEGREGEEGRMIGSKERGLQVEIFGIFSSRLSDPPLHCIFVESIALQTAVDCC